MGKFDRESDVIVNGAPGEKRIIVPPELPDNGGITQRAREIGSITAKVTIDVAEALSGLKALRREADAAVRSLKALDEALGNVSLRQIRVGDYEETEIFRPEVSE